LRLITTGAIVNISSNSDAISLSAPQHSLSLFLNKRFNEKYEGSLAYYYVDAFKWTDARPSAADPYSTDEYNALDVRVSRNFSTRQTNGNLSLVIKNLFDEYSDYLKQPSNSTAPIVIQNTTAYIDFRLNF